MTELERLHYRLLAHFEQLRNQRSGQPVWFVEHGLDQEARGLLEGTVRVYGEEAVTAGRLGVAAWLPLLILCVEVGYDYAGTGTDFWPKVEARLNMSLTATQRGFIRDQFEGPGRALTGVSVRSSPWNKKYNLIAWPITHAVLPREFRGSLLNAIWACPSRLQGKTASAAVVAPLRSWAERNHTRLLTLLADEALASSIVKRMLRQREESPAIGDVALDRMARDLRGDREALRRLREVQRRQDSLNVAPRRPRRLSTDAQDAPRRPRLGYLQLRHSPEQALYVRPPRLPAELAVHAERLARGSRRAGVRLWGRGPLIPLSNLIMGRELRVSGPLPEQDEAGPPPLLAGLPAAMAGDEQLQLHLELMQVPLQRPIVFAGHVGPAGTATQLRDASVFGARRWWVGVDPDDLPEMAPPKGVARWIEPVCGLVVFEVDASRDGALEWLEAVGVRGVSRATVGWIRPPGWGGGSLPGGDGVQADDPVFLRIGGVGAVPLTWGESARPLADGLHRVELGEADTVTIPLRLAARTQAISLEVILPPPPPPLVACRLEGPSLRLEALMGKGLSLRVDAAQPFERLPVRMTMKAAGGRISSAWHELPVLPTRLGPGHRVWRELREAAQDAGMFCAASATLEVEVGSVASAAWTLQAEAAEVWWERRGGVMRAVSEQGEFSHQVVTSLRPLLSEASDVAREGEHTMSLPLMDGSFVLDAGLVAPLRQLELGGALPERPAALRRGVKGVGGDVLDLASSLLAWSTARCETLTSELLRGQVKSSLEGWLVEGLCGAEWVSAEGAHATGPAGASLARALATALVHGDAVRDTYTDESLAEVVGEPRLTGMLNEALGELLGRRGDLLWALNIAVGESASFGASVSAMALDDLGAHDGRRAEITEVFEAILAAVEGLVEPSYLAVKQRIEVELARAVEDYEEPDVALALDEVVADLMAVTEDFRAQREIRSALRMTFPTSARAELATLDFDVSDEDLLGQLVQWEKKHAAGLAPAGPGPVKRFGREGLEALFDLWHRPARAMAMGAWRSWLGTFIGGRLTCRAVRYVVLRRRLALALSNSELS